MHRYLLVSKLFAGSGSPRDPPVIRAIFPFSEKSFDTSTVGVSESGMFDDDVIANEVHKCTTCTRLGCLFRRAAGAGWGMGQILGISRGLLLTISYLSLPAALHSISQTRNHHAQRL
jgi:hypothetical protein